MKLKRQYFDVKDVIFSDKTQYKDGVLSINEEELLEKIRPLMKSVTDVDFELVKPGESARIVHVLDTIQPMYKVEGIGKQYSGFFGHPNVVGEGITNLLRGFTVMESAPLPWDESSASSGLLYPRDAIIDMIGPIAGFTPFSQTINLVITYKLLEGKSSAEYDNDIRLCGLKVSEILAELTVGQVPNEVEEFSISNINPELPNVVLVWQCQNQGVYSNTYLYGHDISNLVPTLLHPNEMLDGCIVSGNYVWPAFKVPTYLHVNHPILLELYRLHNKELNFRGVILSRSHNPTNWHKERSANFCVKLAKYLGADGLIMAWEGGGNAAVDGMLTIQAAEKNGIKASTITFEFGGVDGTEGILLVDDVPEADAIISGGSIEKPYTLPKVERVVGGEVLRLNKESGGYFPPANKSITFDTTTHFYCSGNQSGHGKLFAEAY
ncbi:glycine/sarcosine/betaine reductase component B subunit [Tepidimicrobium xylanilyticum]|uniref:Glycine reductase n=1 Tax=Tepidimicrobium xylanilyticum TaxID=1123352 RepID=A0A1H2RCG4_9FIRM|nr:glycine/sarcosine/betaine reductase component B subunit [Tepidimicrobium xylanilyticum]SDW17153.1 glycine reductase [Tepidimicrobium xylanilyticum]